MSKLYNQSLGEGRGERGASQHTRAWQQTGPFHSPLRPAYGVSRCASCNSSVHVHLVALGVSSGGSSEVHRRSRHSDRQTSSQASEGSQCGGRYSSWLQASDSPRHRCLCVSTPALQFLFVTHIPVGGRSLQFHVHEILTQ
jgi:hypothetical protein